MLNKTITILTLGFSWAIYPVSFLFPRDKKTWIFIGWHKNKEREIFADNSKYLFLHASNNYPEINSIWIGVDKKICNVLKKNGYRAHSIHSIEGIWYSLRAGYTIIDAVMQMKNWRYSGRSKTVQLWHADGIKQLTFTSTFEFKKLKKILLKPGSFKKFFFVIASSDYISKKFTRRSFNLNEAQVRITGLPRYDIFFKKIKNADIDIHTKLKESLDDIELKKSERTILYAPTFRRGKNLTEQLSPINFEKLNNFLVEKNYYLIVSLHPKFSESEWIPEKEFSNVYFSNPGYDQYSLLKRFDLLVTDYSSVCVDFLLLNKPTIFYTYDIKEYRKKEGLAEEFWNYMPGPRVNNYETLIEALATDISILKKNNDSVRKEIFKYTDGDSSERITREILDDINK